MVHPSAHSQDRLRQEIEKLIRYETEIDFEKTPGFVIGIVAGDSCRALPFGSQRKDTIMPPGKHTLFEIGGLTHVFTAALASRLAAEGIIHPDSSINCYLPENQRNSSADVLSVLRFLTHTSGLPGLPFGIGKMETDDRQPYSNYAKTDLLTFFKNYHFKKNETGKYQFSHVNYALLEVALEQAAGRDFESLLFEKICHPLGLKNTEITLDEMKLSKLAPGFEKSGAPALPWQFQSYSGALGLKSDASDLMLFLKSQLKPPPGFEPPLLGAGGRGFFPTEIRKDTWVAWGWHVIRRRRRPDIVTHTGATAGHRAAIAFTPETGAGVVILSNATFGFDGLEYLVLDLVNQALTKK